jgi:LDH2 family malate/lactate/ureidoglycolate dehydrogenase
MGTRAIESGAGTILRFPVSRIEQLCRDVFVKCGLLDDDAAIMADTVMKAEIRGIGSHGLMRLPAYCKRLIDKGSNPRPQLRTLVDLPSLMLIDGDNGLGQVVSVNAMQTVIGRAKQHGICFAGVTNSGHFGFGGYYPMMAASQGLIGIAASNCPPNMAVWGGSRAAIGNNPLAVAIPTAGAYPLVLDIAMSVVSGGKVRLSAIKGTKIPLDWILDGEGRRTDNPSDLGVTGTLLPLGHKGSGLAIMIEVLTSILTQSAMLSEIGLWFRDTSKPLNNGHFFGAINIEALVPLVDFKARIDVMIDELKSSPTMEGLSGIYMPGEIDHAAEQACLTDGVAVPTEVLKLVNDLAERLGVAPVPESAAPGESVNGRG